MPMVRIGKHIVSRLIMGINTLGSIDASHMSRMIDLEMTAQYKPETAPTSTTQKPEAFEIIESEGSEMDYCMTCLSGPRRSQTKQPCFAYGGRLCQKPELVEAAFKGCFANIKPTAALVVGMFNKHEYQYVINVGYARCLGSNTTT